MSPSKAARAIWIHGALHERDKVMIAYFAEKTKREQSAATEGSDRG